MQECRAEADFATVYSVHVAGEARYMVRHVLIMAWGGVPIGKIKHSLLSYRD